jgi:hypothetical protein
MGQDFVGTKRGPEDRQIVGCVVINFETVQ